MQTHCKKYQVKVLDTATATKNGTFREDKGEMQTPNANSSVKFLSYTNCGTNLWLLDGILNCLV